jgi:hypothetical protein
MMLMLMSSFLMHIMFYEMALINRSICAGGGWIGFPGRPHFSLFSFVKSFV